MSVGEREEEGCNGREGEMKGVGCILTLHNGGGGGGGGGWEKGIKGGGAYWKADDERESPPLFPLPFSHT